MTENRAFKQLIRHRMLLKGESFSVARSKINESKAARAVNIARPLDFIFDDADLARILPLLKGEAAIVITGSSGSGKTDTLHSLVEFVTREVHNRVVLIEDFPEVVLSDSTPTVVQVAATGGVTSADLVKSTLWLKADTIAFQKIDFMAGMPETLFQVSGVGYQVFTTMWSPSDGVRSWSPAVRSQVQCISAFVEQVFVMDRRNEARTMLTNVVVMTPELRDIILRSDGAAEAKYFANPSTPDLRHKLAKLQKDKVIKRVDGRFELV